MTILTFLAIGWSNPIFFSLKPAAIQGESSLKLFQLIRLSLFGGASQGTNKQTKRLTAYCFSGSLKEECDGKDFKNRFCEVMKLL